MTRGYGESIIKVKVFITNTIVMEQRYKLTRGKRLQIASNRVGGYHGNYDKRYC